MAKEKRLGRGLEALLGRVAGTGSQESFEQWNEPTEISENPEADWLLQQRLAGQTPERIDIMLIDRNPYQPRQDFDETDIEQLAASLETHGLLQPIVVRKVGERFQIIAGERRFRAATRAGWCDVPVHVREADDRQMVELAITENVQRKDLNAIEKAVSMARYLEVYGGTHEELAKRLELDRSTVTNLLRLLDLPQELQDAVRKNRLTQGHVRALLPLKHWEQKEVADRIQAEGWSVRETERFVKTLIESGQPLDQAKDWNLIGKDGETRPVNRQSEHVRQLEQDFREFLGGMKVKLTQSGEKGKGKLVINFANNDEFERIYTILRSQNTRTAQ